MTKHAPPRYKINAAGKCLWPVPETILPNAITRSYSFKYYGQERSWMSPYDTGCPTWEQGGNEKKS